MRCFQSFTEESFCRECISFGTQHEIKGITFRIHGSIEILPLTLYLNIGQYGSVKAKSAIKDTKKRRFNPFSRTSVFWFFRAKL
jgi:hypothetical protein